MAARLSFDERVRIEVMHQEGAKVIDIAEALDRHFSTVYRELKRSGCGSVYDADLAQTVAEAAARRPKPTKAAREAAEAEEARKAAEAEAAQSTQTQ